ncbi:uncharacterized protein MONBRDRAFT_12266 [Monosiga brevicollis MX1]|uniref:Dynein heavy chain, cytoplasmic n=1 Tax=Monosiga brevicollis TaxID=81824 RepID=A9VBQ7_MONBE|nr:uncharacterized protein MONBRDRAFT_12266 [Monosiga brevicollis MX1]EDQ84975.1 predicted protein [Monosiga brevicollis MX1]|eukprot:XP_001750145.1 hypothetical protein [Monosiga brevicollis MX1]
MQNFISPFFSAVVKTLDVGAKDGVKEAQKAVVDLETHLSHLQQDTDIPKFEPHIDPDIAKALAAAQAQGRTATVADLGPRATDPNFLKSLERVVARWITDIQKITMLDRDPSSGTARQEISFWPGLASGFEALQERLHGRDITLTLDVLKDAGRQLLPMRFASDTNLTRADTVKEYATLMSNFPINEMLTATELSTLRDWNGALFGPLTLAHAIFARTYDLLKDIDKTWQEQVGRNFLHIHKVTPPALTPLAALTTQGKHKPVLAKMTLMYDFRNEHHKLASVIGKVLAHHESGDEDEAFLTEGDLDAIEEVRLAYEEMRTVDVMDLSEAGDLAWDRAMKKYGDRIDKVETTIIERLSDQLSKAKSSSEMFRIFNRFNALFVRQRIRGAVRSYQKELIKKVKEDIKHLHEKFKASYYNSNNSDMSHVRDIPPVSGQIIWSLQIKRQLDQYMDRVKSVLGDDWEKQAEGRELKEDQDYFKSRLDRSDPYDAWLADVESRDSALEEPIFDIELFRGEQTRLEIFVNFHDRLITMAKEVRNLKALKHHKIPFGVAHKAKKVDGLYPFVICLKAAVKTYTATLDRLSERPHLHQLVAQWHANVQSHLAAGINYTWSSNLEQYAFVLMADVTQFEDKTEVVFARDNEVQQVLEEVQTCPFTPQALTALRDRLQNTVQAMLADGFINMQHWFEAVEASLEARLVGRLEKATEQWCRALTAAIRPQTEWDMGESDEASTKDLPSIKSHRYELQLHAQTIALQPPMERVQMDLMHQLQDYLAAVTSLPRVVVDSTGQLSAGPMATRTQASYGNLLVRLPSERAALIQAFTMIQERTRTIDVYVQQWFGYQTLWDVQLEVIVQELGGDLERWQELLTDIKKARKLFDTSETVRRFGCAEVDFAQVQSRIALKYDSIHREFINHFAHLVGETMQAFYSDIHASREKLESISMSTTNTEDSIQNISLIQRNRKKVAKYVDLVDQCLNSESLLERQRYPLPAEWLRAQQLSGEWEAFLSILKRRENACGDEMVNLQKRIVDEERSLETQIAELVTDWDRNKPSGGDVSPDDAVNHLQIFEGRFVRLKDEYESLVHAKQALDLETKDDHRLETRLEELRDLKGSWNELSRVVQKMNELRSTEWGAVVPTKVRAALQGLIDDMKAMPTRVKSYPAYELLLDAARAHLKVNETVAVLRGDALKARHWKMLLRALQVNWDMATLTLGQVWAVDLLANAHKFQEVLLQAQGEKALEEFLKKIKEDWQTYELELVNYHNKTKLIKGWEDLFTLAKDHLNNLAQMRLSAYFKVFEEEAVAWEQKLNAIYTLFCDVWIDVQRKWVYLEGIFSGSADLKALLPVETNKFQGLSNEFVGLMRKVSKQPLVVEVMNIPNLPRTLDHLKDVLENIQKALSKYLEQERASFPRFYFVGDEDLLDIIGNGKNVDRIQKHFKKMFAGVTSIVLRNDNAVCAGIESKEGELVPYADPVQVKDQKINTWLTAFERAMKLSLASLLATSTARVDRFRGTGFDLAAYLQWLDEFQAQLVLLSGQVSWSRSAEAALAAADTAKELSALIDSLVTTLNGLADTVLQHQPVIRRKKLEQMITELVHKRDLTRSLLRDNVASREDFAWLQNMRFYFDANETEVLRQLSIGMADTTSYYGFEYLGFVDKLVQTPLTDRCFLTMTQALAARQGGSPFGPAGTGKTESVKALGAQLGRFVLVFNCDETFDNHAMSRIFVGLCQVGAWGCFDEFNRLEESMLSAVSQQIESIQLALKAGAGKTGEEAKRAMTVRLSGGNPIPVNPDMAIFITMNPGYAGRSPLPDNLKKLFRNLAMTKPDRQLIAQVMLYSQGFRTAEELSRKVVPLFILCAEQLSAQSHYDFGLRSLKSVLVSAGNIKRDRLAAARQALTAAGRTIDEEAVSASIDESEVVIQSITQTMIPKLIAQDIPLLNSLLADVFPGVTPPEIPLDELKQHIRDICQERHYVVGDMWLTKVLQLYQVTTLNHGLMLVGPSGVGKSVAWSVLLEALRRWEKKEAESYVIDPKAISKEQLYGYLDMTTREWTDGLFTHIVRKIIDNVRGERNKRQWIIFDGDVDPEWVENLNSVLDDNKLLTLPNGERLNLPENIRIIFEVQDLKNATLATVSRCGMVWFSEEVLTLDMNYTRFLTVMRNEVLSEDSTLTEADQAAALRLQGTVADTLAVFFQPDGLVSQSLSYCQDLFHVMDYTPARCLNALFCMLNQICNVLSEYNQTHPDFPLTEDQVAAYTQKRFLYSLMWCLVGDSRGAVRSEMSTFLKSSTTIDTPDGDIIDYKVALPDATWQPWADQVPRKEIETDQIAGTDVVVPTLDTVRHEDLLYTWLSEHLPIVLCGPPGSGKTMTLFSALRALPHFDVAGLNFSSTTTPELLMKTFDQYCEYRRTANGLVLAPTQLNKWLIVFMDECNLPAADKYNTVKVITFVRQLVEQGGFWNTDEHTWVKLERIQFVGACNPPTDPGRVPLAHRFLRHIPVVYVDYPGAESLKQIYGTFNRAVLRPHPNLEPYGDTLTEAMVDFYMQSQQRFTADMQPHYIYSPREMTRWVKGVAEAIGPLAKSGVELKLEGLVRVWAHEALRLFQDRLVYDEERQWTDEKVDEVAKAHFRGIDLREAIGRPILFSDWLTNQYGPVDQEELREFVREKLHTFTEEQLDVELVLFDEVLDHVLRIDRVFRQNQGHMLLIGTSGCGRTTLSRFVAWMNDLSVVQIKAHNAYTASDFDNDLRDVLRRSGVDGEKIVFILDEGSLMDTAFLERMNTLLANGEVPGLFEDEDYAALMSKCKEASRRQQLNLDDNDELYKWFSRNVMNNLHIVFTMCPSEAGMQDRASTSPALFNRCVLDWFGDWSDRALFRVARDLTVSMGLELATYEAPMDFPAALADFVEAPTYQDAIHNAAVYVHTSAKQAVRMLAKREGRIVSVTPRHYLEFLEQFARFVAEKRRELEEQKEHLLSGVIKIAETKQTVEEMQGSLAEKEAQLKEKSELAKQKLEVILEQKQAANDKKTESLKIDEELQVKQQQANERKAQVEEELAAVAPAVEEAKQAVSGISKKDLDEVRKLINPPKKVKLALEGALTLMGKHTTDWKQIRSLIAQDNFTRDVRNFDTESVTPKVMKQLQPYLDDPDFTFEAANKASKAAGPLVKWARASVLYATQLLKIEPLTNELRDLERAAEDMQVQQAELQVLIQELESKIQELEADYAVLISEQEAIKASLATVLKKVERSEKLLRDLSSERERWSDSAKDFDAQMITIVGDCLLAAAFVAYGGYFDQSYRQMLLFRWSAHLTKARIQHKPGIEEGLPEYLSSPDDRLRWKNHSLPEDELCLQNAVTIKRSIRAPLIIDPSGQALAYIQKEKNEGGKLVTTSFLNTDQLRKDLESALRFGTTLLILDAESFDPIVNPVLNNEVQRKGGRVFINVAGKDIDLSHKFSMILITRSPGTEFPVDICSRVTLVNFTVTRSSLQTQCINQALRSERPDVDKQRGDLLRMQGEFRLKLLQLENQLLDALNKAEGSILDNDAVISQLETLKSNAMEIEAKVRDTDSIMKNVEAVSKEYMPLAQRCSAIFFTLQQMSAVHFLYQYSLQFFLDIFTVVLNNDTNPALAQVAADDFERRIGVINDSIFQFVYDRVAPGMLHEHRLPLALTFARFRVAGDADEIPEVEMNHFLTGAAAVMTGETAFDGLLDHGMTVEQTQAMHALSQKLTAFQALAQEVHDNRDAFVNWLQLPRPELELPTYVSGLHIEGSDSAVRKLFREILLLQAARPDRVLTHAHRLVHLVLGDSFGALSMDQDPNGVLKTQITAATPVLLCGAKGFDTSVKVDDFANAAEKQVTAVAVGAASAAREALDVLRGAIANGRWVVLKNVHLAPSLLVKVEKLLSTSNPNPNFRLFLTSEISPKLPVTLVRTARTFIYEAPAGVKASVTRALQSFSDQIDAAPSQRAHLYLLLAWLHGVIQERLRYAPLGWSKKYEFGEPDLRTAADTIHTWIDRTADGQANVEPAAIPWEAIRTLLSKSVYGGRIDNEIDQRLLEAFVASVFTEQSFSPKFEFVQADKSSSTPSIKPPQGKGKQELIAWAASLPDAQMPTWLGLPANAEAVLLSNRAKVLAINIQMLQTTDDDSLDLGSAEDSEHPSSATPAWMRTLKSHAAEWLSVLPPVLNSLLRTADSIKDPLFRFFERETTIGVQLLQRVRRDLDNVIKVCEGEMKQTNEMRSLFTALVAGSVPKSWQLYKIPDGMPVAQWVADFAQRTLQLQSIEHHVTAGNPLPDLRVWLGGLFVPEAYITATRQAVAQRNNWPLEKLALELEVRSGAQDTPSELTNSFLITNLRIEGATSKGRTFALVDVAFTMHPLTVLRWVLHETEPDTTQSVNVPLYLNTTRANLIAVVPFLPPADVAPTVFYQRGVAMACSSLSGVIA